MARDRSGSVASVQSSQTRYAQNVASGAGDWSSGCGSVNEDNNPMKLAAAQAQKAVANYSTYLNGGQWAANLAEVSLTSWKLATANGSAGAQKYAMAKGAAKWGKWYANVGMNMASNMRGVAAAGRQQNMPYMQRIQQALAVAEQVKGQKG